MNTVDLVRLVELVEKHNLTMHVGPIRGPSTTEALGSWMVSLHNHNGRARVVLDAYDDSLDTLIEDIVPFVDVIFTHSSGGALCRIRGKWTGGVPDVLAQRQEDRARRAGRAE